MRAGRAARIALVLVALFLAAILAAPWIAKTYWTVRSSNPVRRGVQRARELGCFSCHGQLGGAGIKDPGAVNLEVPAWSGGIYMMYVNNDDDIRRFVLNGSTPKVEPQEPLHTDPPGVPTRDQARPAAAISMPAFRDMLQGRDLEDLTAAFRILSGMSHPPADTPEDRGHQVSRTWGCVSCHGPGGSGGLPNPGSFTGFIPGWYGADFKDMVRGREEFNTWIREGGIPRLTGNPLASYFMRRQRIQMPRYRNLTQRELDDLWAYVRWLDGTGGGIHHE